MGVELSDVFVILKPQQEWTTATTRDALIEKLKEKITDRVPGVGLGFTQPIEMRFNELIAGVRSDLAVKVFGPDLDVLKQQAEIIARTLEKIRGAADVKVEQVAGLPLLRVIVDREGIARYGLTADDVLTLVQATRVGHVVGTVIQGSRRFDLVVRLTDQAVADNA
jgi:cobalt-zinc-cadmium resistance protein CzcA